MNARRIKWRVLAVFWAVQAITQFVIAVLWFSSAGEVDGPREAWVGVPTPTKVWELATDPDFAGVTGIMIGIVTLAQALLVWPVARPSAVRSRGWPVWISLGVAGVAITALCLAAIWTVNAIPFAIGSLSDESSMIAGWSSEGWSLIGVMVLATWIPANVLLIRFARGPGARLSRETLVTQVASLIFRGTLVEIAAIIPLDVMVRRRSDCYCGSGTFAALTVCGTIGLFAFGPAIFLPLLARRRRAWQAGKCEVCGYDMSGNLKAERCPECGCGWKPSPDESV